MSLRFNYDNTSYVWIPVTRTATTSLRSALMRNSDITLDWEYKLEVEARADPYVRTYNHVTYEETQAFTSTDGTETYFSVVRNPMDRCISLYNYMRSAGWCAGTTFDSYWAAIIDDPTHEPNVAPGAYTIRLQKDIVNTSGTIYKYETELSDLQNHFNITMSVENEKPNVVSNEEIEAARSLIETHFNDDYIEFGYSKGNGLP